jgi:glycosyltransferase involved in cell wall biosynthesis
LLKAIQLLKNEPIEFHFVGPVQISIPINTIRAFAGSAPFRGRRGRFLSKADVLIFPTLSDGFGLTQLEAPAWSLPIITSRFCGVVDDGVNGIVLDELARCTRGCL